MPKGTQIQLSLCLLKNDDLKRVAINSYVNPQVLMVQRQMKTHRLSIKQWVAKPKLAEKPLAKPSDVEIRQWCHHNVGNHRAATLKAEEERTRGDTWPAGRRWVGFGSFIGVFHQHVDYSHHGVLIFKPWIHYAGHNCWPSTFLIFKNWSHMCCTEYKPGFKQLFMDLFRPNIPFWQAVP